MEHVDKILLLLSCTMILVSSSSSKYCFMYMNVNKAQVPNIKINKDLKYYDVNLF